MNELFVYTFFNPESIHQYFIKILGWVYKAIANYYVDHLPQVKIKFQSRLAIPQVDVPKSQ